MSSPTPDDVRAFVAVFLNAKLKERGKAPMDHLPDDYDLLLSGLLELANLRRNDAGGRTALRRSSRF